MAMFGDDDDAPHKRKLVSQGITFFSHFLILQLCNQLHLCFSLTQKPIVYTEEELRSVHEPDPEQQQEQQRQEEAAHLAAVQQAAEDKQVWMCGSYRNVKMFLSHIILFLRDCEMPYQDAFPPLPSPPLPSLPFPAP